MQEPRPSRQVSTVCNVRIPMMMHILTLHSQQPIAFKQWSDLPSFLKSHYFEGLRISERRPNDSEKNTNIVINISFKESGNGSYASFLRQFEKNVSWVYHDFLELCDSPRLSPTNHEDFRKICEKRADEYDLSTCIQDLCRMLELHHGRKVVILIDEYDNAMNKAYKNPEDHEKIVDFMRTLLGSALKDNDSLRFAVVTGVMKISKESIFSGLNPR